jgi:hypothetical protein
MGYTAFSSITQQKSMAQITAPCPNKRKPYSQNMKHLLQVLFCFGKNEINIFPRVIIENDNPIFLLF